LQSEIKKHTIRGGAIVLLTQVMKFLLQIGSTAVLARLLIPEDYGLLGMVTVVISFASLFKDLGLSNATIQKSEVTQQQVSTLFWINFAVSCLIAVLVGILAPAVSWFYQEKKLTDITLALASTFILGGLSIQHQALLTRQMQFWSLAKIEIISMTLGVISAILTAWRGWGYWALVMMPIISATVNASGVWLVCGWRPSQPVAHSGVRSMLIFGSNLTGANIVNYFSRNLDNILIARFWGSQQLGLYAKAYQLVLLPVQQINAPISSVVLPVLSRLKDEPQRYKKYYYKAVLLIATIGMPIVFFLMATIDQVILLVLGEQWLEVIPIFRFLMPAAFNSTIAVGLGWVCQSLNKADRFFLWGIISSIMNIVSFIIGIRWGAIGVAAAYGASQPIQLVAGFIYCFKGTPLSPRELAHNLSKPFLASLGALSIIIASNHFHLLNRLSMLTAFLTNSIVFALFYLGIWLILPNGRTMIIEILSLLKSMGAQKTN
jgi:O-antigen/teichoic acid export membrane protein